MADPNYIASKFDLDELYRDLYGYVAPPFPAFGNIGDQITPSNPLSAIAANLDQFKKSALNIEMALPLKLSIEGFEWQFPLEPIVSISGGNMLIMRYPNRPNGQGSHKERWAKKDYTVTVKGVLVDLADENYPADQISALRRFFDHEGSIKADNTLFRLFGFEYIAIEDFDIPFTEGQNMQEFSFTCYSDQLFNSLLTEL